MTDLQDRILSITGHTADIHEALDEMDSMKTAIGELYDDNQALEILNRRLRLCLDLAQTSITAIETDAAMFITDKTRKKLHQFSEQVAKLNGVVSLSKEIVENDTQYRSIPVL